ncbi:MAG: AraC family transcriptional regulator [Sinobacterium sp.]|nr:AraC family transcriptional regulator [Sinobacterium sp.]
MNQWNFKRNIMGIRVLTDFGEKQGVSRQQCLAGSGIKVTDLDSPDSVVSAEQELRTIRNLQNHLPHILALGVRVGMCYHYTTFGILGYALASSPNARSALDIAMRYFNLTFAFSRFEAKDTEFETVVNVDASEVPEDVKRFIIERDTAAFASVQAGISNTKALSRIRFSFEQPKDISIYQQAFGVTPEFNTEKTTAILSKAALSKPFPQSNALVLKSCEEQCEQLLKRYESSLGLPEKVRHFLVQDISTDMESVAKALFMTSRTLRRHLCDENTSFNEIKDDVRMAFAEEFLIILHLSVNETAYRLGYSSSQTFIAAFKRLKGDTPHAFRNKSHQSSHQIKH